MPTVVVFGSNAAEANDAGYREAYELGLLLGQEGYTVATGGYYGTMEAVSRGAREAGAHVIGVTTSLFDSRGGANRYVQEETKFPNLFQRLHHLVTFSDASVVLRGGVGTLCEVALTWSLLQTGEMRRKPFIVVGPHWRRILETFFEESTATDRDRALIRFAANVHEVIPLLQRNH